MERRKVVRLCAAVLIVTCLSAPVMAQRLTGIVQGTVRDQQGGVLPGVTVEVSSPELLGGPRTVVTEADGTYRVPALAPGTYTLMATLAGFQKHRLEGIRVSMGSTVTQDVVLKVSAIEETVTVTGRPPTVDVSNSGVAANYGTELIEKLPLGRNSFLDAFVTAPGITTTSPVTTASASVQGANTYVAYGSDRYANAFRFDGVDATDIDTSGARIQPIPGIFQEVQVVGLGAPAEYGGFMGVAVNVISKSGGNDFRGSANFYLQTGSLTGNNAPEGMQPFHRDNYHDFSVMFGGPIKKDKIWFFGAYQYLKDSFTNFQVDPTYPTSLRTDRYFAKISWAISPNHEFWFSFHDEVNDFPGTLTATNTPDTLRQQNRTYPTPSAHWRSVLNDKTFFEAGYSGWYMHDYSLPMNGNYTNHFIYDGSTGLECCAPSFWYKWWLNRTQINASLTRFAEGFMGRHDLKLGVQYNRGISNAIIGYGGGANWYFYAGQPVYAYYQTPHWYGALGKNLGVFADDTWQVNDRLTVNLGLRFERDTADILGAFEMDANANPTDHYINGIPNAAKWTTLTPRLGLVYQLTADHKTALKLNYGRYADSLKVSHVEGVAPTISPMYIQAWNPDSGAFDVPLAVYDPVSNAAMDSNLKPTYSDLVMASFQRELAPDVAVSVTGIYKPTRNIVAFWNSGAIYEPAQFYDAYGNKTIQVWNQTNSDADNFYVVTNPSMYKHDYRGLVLELNKRQSKNWQFSTSLTISRSDGVGATGRTGQGNTNLPGDPFIRDKNMLVNNSGPLQGDRPYMFKAFGTYNLPYGILVGGNFTYQTGAPFARTVFLNTVNQKGLNILAEERGSRRFDSLNVLDVRVEKEFRFAKGRGLVFTLDVFNLFNAGTVADVKSTVGTSSNFLVPSNIVRPRLAQLAFRVLF